MATTPRTASVSGGALEKAGLVTIAMRGRERVYQLETERLRSAGRGGGSAGSGELGGPPGPRP